MRSSLFCLMIGFISILMACNSKPKPYITGKEDTVLPDFHLVKLDGSLLTIQADSVYKSRLIFYYLPTCPYCRNEMKQIVSSPNNMRHTKVYIIGTGNLDKIKDIVKEFELASYSNVVLGYDSTMSIQQYFKLTGVPFFASLDQHNRVKEAYRGKTINRAFWNAIADSTKS